MNTKRSCLYSLLAIVLLWGGITIPAKAGSTLWYNGDADGTQLGLTNQSGSGGSIVYNQFTVTGSGWNISQIWSNNVFYNISFDGNNLVYNSTVPASASPISTTANWDIRTGMVSPGGGTSVASGNLSSATLTPTGLLGYAGLPEYQLSVSGLTGTIAGGNLTAGNYWLAVYTDNTYGGNVVNDFASTAANAVGTPTGANNDVWTEDPFGVFTEADPLGNSPGTSAGIAGDQLNATPEPATLTLFGLGIAGLAGYSWRRRPTKVCPA